MKVFIASDHAGYWLKEALKKRLTRYHILDMGAESEAPVDYPTYAAKVVAKVKKREGLGILICGTGIGMTIAANREPGIRAALAYTTEVARLSREHNDANILCLGGRTMGEEAAYAIAEAFLTSSFTGEERHRRRIKMLDP